MGTLAAFGVTDIAMSSFKLTLAEPLSRGFAWLTAITVTLAGDGITAGAVYSPEPEIVPLAAVPPTTLFTSHVTTMSELPLTVD